MKPSEQFLRQPKSFWAHVRSISQERNYTDRETKQIKVPNLSEIRRRLQKIGLSTEHIMNDREEPAEFGATLLAYFRYRADVLGKYAEPRLMDVERAKEVFEQLRTRLSPRCPIPMNKQGGEKKAFAYLTGIVNMLVEANAEGFPCHYDPRKLTTITRHGVPLRTLARRMDGAFPNVVNPIAVWEIKEYYYTTTFGSRVADGVYETLLDGMELEELREHEQIDVKHYLIADAHYTWWVCGRSYLCRIIDMLHMGYVDEVLFGYEVVERLPEIVREWVRLARARA
ncbi:MAG: hypothetical protein HYR55_00250 [Acidobacteria bacterium]|nr:hypothetical protein [Acidobacteriota bacterium]MBI3655327.1 hypothetical protein [Acidobacteriota bacterium]